MSGEKSQERFKAAARRFASGVTVVTTCVGREVHGITASSFASLSLDPLLVGVAVHERSRLVQMVESADCFGISVLGRSQRELSRSFAVPDRPPSPERFEGAATYVAATGAPIFAGCIAYFDCVLHSILPSGDHRILVGEVVAAGESDGEPLLYFEGEYHALGLPQEQEPVEIAELLAVKRALEPTIAELAAITATDDDLARLRSLLDSAARATGDPRRFTSLGAEFHVALADISRNRRLRELAVSLHEEQPDACEPWVDESRARRTVDAHERILTGVTDRDAGRARAAMAEHVDDVQRHVADEASSFQRGESSIGRTSMPFRTSASMESPK